MSKFLNSTGLATLWGKIKALFVQKEVGKGLSSNDYTDADKAKIASLESKVSQMSAQMAAITSLVFNKHWTGASVWGGKSEWNSNEGIDSRISMLETILSRNYWIGNVEVSGDNTWSKKPLWNRNN